MIVKHFLSRALAITAGAVVFVATLAISVVLFAVILALAVVFGGYFFWKTRHLRRQMRQQFEEGEIIEGTVEWSEEEKRLK